MATATIKLTSYTTITVTYTLESISGLSYAGYERYRAKVTNVKFTNSRSGGTTDKVYLSVDTDVTPYTYVEDAGGTSVSATIAAGTKSKSWSINDWVILEKQRGSKPIKLTFEAHMELDSDYTTYWEKATSVTATMPSRSSWTVALNANGGSGGTASLTKWHGEPLDLTAGFTAPTRVGYRFEGWALTSGGAKIDEYDVDEATPLYAVWTPVITGVSLDVHTLRVENGTSTSESDDGDHCYGTVAYTVTGGAAGKLALSLSADDSAVVFDSGQNVELTKNADTALTGTHVFRASNCDTDTKITFTVSGSATNTSVSGEAPVPASQSDVLSVAYFPLDILGDNYASQGQRPGHGLAIGLPAKKEGFAVGMDLFFQQWAGIIQMFAGTTPPAGWLLCDGSAVSRTEYATLYAAIGDTWGAGDGSTTFNLPDLRGRAPIGAGTGTGLSARTLGGTVGAETVTLTSAQSGLPAHTHAFSNVLTNPETVARRTVSSGSGATNHLYSSGATSRANTTGAVSGGAKGATSAHNNMQPSAVVNFIIHTGKTS